MVTQIPGVGQVYLGTYKDSDSDWLNGSRQYKLHVAPGVPVTQFWSITVYDVDSRCLIDNPKQEPDRSSRMDLEVNDDGSTDLYIGPTPPEGKERNWVQTLPDKGWFSYFRLYGPEQAHFDRAWILQDFDKADW